MSLPSDTESDSPSIPPPQESLSGKLVAPYTQCNPVAHEDVDISYPRILNSLKLFFNQNLPLCEDESTSTMKIQIASDLLLQFLATVPVIFELGEQTADTFRVLGELANVAFFQRLLNYRKALRETTPLDYVNEMPSVMITWVDVVLARLVITTPIVISGSANARMSTEQGPDWLLARQEDDAVRVATQLPDSWAGIVATIGSTHASPAARRLATRLTFFAYIVSPKLNDSDPWSTASVSPVDLMERLYKVIGHAGCYNTSPTNTHFASMERVQVAMLISLFSAAHSKVDGMNELAQLRPDGFGHILEMIQEIMQPEDARIHPLDELDVAQCILVRWGDFVPWTWSIWNDQRIARSEVSRLLAATWLFHLNTPLYAPILETYDQPNLTVDLRSVLLKDVSSSSAMILQIFQEAMKNLESAQDPFSSVRIILNKICWSIIQYFEVYLAHQNSNPDDQFSEFGRLLLVAAVHSHLREDGYILRVLIVEALVLIPTGIMGTLTRSVIADKKALFMTCLDETIRHSLKISSTQDVGFSMTDFSTIKSILELCCVMLSHTSCGDPGLKAAAAVYVERVFTLLVQEGPDSTGTTILLGGFLTLLGTLRRHKYAVNINEDELWALITPSCYLDITIPFALYVFGTLDRPRDPLLALEAWDHVLNALRMIVDEQLTDEEEPLALLAVSCLCSTICGVSSSTNTSDSTRFYLRSSPWTQTMLLSVSQILDGEWPDRSFRRTLQDRLQLGSIGRAFLREFGPQEEPEPRSASQSEPLAAQWPCLVYYRDTSFAGLIPVLDIE